MCYNLGKIQYQNSILQLNYKSYEKNVLKQNCPLQKGLQILSDQFLIGTFLTCIIYVFILKNTIQNEKFYFLIKICGIRKKGSNAKSFA